jgi:hypothetical protein
LVEAFERSGRAAADIAHALSEGLISLDFVDELFSEDTGSRRPRIGRPVTPSGSSWS